MHTQYNKAGHDIVPNFIAEDDELCPTIRLCRRSRFLSYMANYVVFVVSDVDDRHNLGLRFEGDPDPHPLTHAPHLGHQLVQLQVLAHQVHKEGRMQPLGMLPRALQPARNRPLVMAEDARGG